MGADTRLAYIRYTRARVRRLAVVPGGVAAAWQRRGGGRRGGVAVAIHDTFISTSAKNAQYSTALPYVKPRQIAKNRLVLPN